MIGIETMKTNKVWSLLKSSHSSKGLIIQQYSQYIYIRADVIRTQKK